MTRAGEGDAALRGRLLWLAGLRVVSVTGLLGGAVLVRATSSSAVPVDPYFTLIAVTYGLTAIWAGTVRYAERARWLVVLQIGADAVLVAGIVLVTGGIGSPFASLFVLPVVAASIVERRHGGLLLGLSSAVLLGTVVAMQYSGAFGLFGPGRLAPGAGALPPVREAWYVVLFNGLGFVSVGLLTGYLADRLRQAGADLQDASSRIADLTAFNQHVIDSLSGGLATTDRSGRILTFNRTAQAITGATAADAVGRPVWDVLQLPADFRGGLATVVEGGLARRREVAFVRPGGQRLEIGLTVSPLVTGTAHAGFILTFQDLTDDKRREREAQAQKRLAAIGEMAAGIAHELRNPLASMTGSIQVLGEELTLTGEQAHLLDIVLRESRRLDETIANFLAYARPQRRSETRFELRRLLSETALLLRNGPGFGERHRLDVEAPASDVWLEGDEAQVRQVVWNLASNGLRAMPDGGRLVLRVEEPCSAGGVVLSVEDEGIGIEPDALEQIFHPFRSTFPRGTGLGLAIVHRIVTEHGGEIAVSSTPGQGTRVRVSFPPRPQPASLGSPAAFAEPALETGTYARR